MNPTIKQAGRKEKELPYIKDNLPSKNDKDIKHLLIQIIRRKTMSWGMKNKNKNCYKNYIENWRKKAVNQKIS